MEWLVIGLIFVLCLGLPTLLYWKIFSRVGLPGPLALLGWFPGVNILVLVMLAFSDLPEGNKKSSATESGDDKCVN